MSYTMTIDEPKEAAWFEETIRTMSPSELGSFFVVLLRQHMAKKGVLSRRAAAQPHGESITDMLSGVARNVAVDDDHGILARAALEKYERISQ